MPSNDEIRQLQQLLLQAAITGRNLPGGNRPVQFPDLAFITRQPAIFVLDENLAGSVSLEDSPLPLRILSRELLEEEARTRKESVAYLAFNNKVLSKDEVQLTLEGRIVGYDSAEAVPLGLSSIHVTFRKLGGRWEITGEPSFSAA